jgi:hypothetical protein
MAGNLAQILRTWAASSILSGKIPIPDLVFPRYAYQAAGQSTPFSLISWDPSHHHLIGRHDTVLQLSAIQTGRIPQRKTDSSSKGVSSMPISLIKGDHTNHRGQHKSLQL